MQISITARHFDLTQKLKDRTQEQLEKLERYGITLTEAHAVFSVEKYRHKSEITLHGQGINISGSAESDDMFTSVDQTVSKLEEQVRRFKEKQSSRKQRSDRKSGGAVIDLVAPKRSGSNDKKIDVVQSGQMTIPTMTVEEAILELEQNKDEYLLFTNPVTDKVNILTRREDGNYGVVET